MTLTPGAFKKKFSRSGSNDGISTLIGKTVTPSKFVKRNSSSSSEGEGTPYSIRPRNDLIPTGVNVRKTGDEIPNVMHEMKDGEPVAIPGQLGNPEDWELEG